MARTKQTSRYSTAQMVPRAQLVTQKIAKRSVHVTTGGKGPVKTKKLRRGRSVSSSSSFSSSSSVDVTRQQFSLKFDNQPDCQKKAIKAPRYECKKCKAILSHFSEFQNMQAEEERKPKSRRSLSDEKRQEIKSKKTKLWVCQFCGFKNDVPANIEIPEDDNPCYFLGAEKDSKKGVNRRGEKMIIYCIDISGSMDTDFKGKTRLEAVKEAIRDEIKRMKFQGENTKVAVITFGSEVNVMIKPKNVQIHPMDYNDFDKIAASASKIKEFALPVQTHHKHFEKLVGDITTYGCTALGPALVTAIELAGRVRGSKVVLCTDGMANRGIMGSEFYTRAANFAKNKGVMVSILSIKGDPCNLKELGKLSLTSGGSILKIDPDLFGSEFNKISKENIFGTDTNMRIVVNHFFEIEGESPEEVSRDKTILTQDFGNFTAETELTFNFRMLSSDEAAIKGVNMEIVKQKRLPMQVQLTYLNPDGQRYLQVVNDHRQFTQDRDIVLGDTSFTLFAGSMLQKVSKLIKEEKFDQAETEIKRYKSMVSEVFQKKQSKAELDKFNGRIDKLGLVLASKKLKKAGKAAFSGKGGVPKKKAVKIVKSPVVLRRKRGKGGVVAGKTGKDAILAGKGGKGGKGAIVAESEVQDYDDYLMESDQEAEIMYNQIRARCD